MKLGWASAALYSTCRSYSPRAIVVRQKPLAPIVQIDFSGHRWFAVCTAPSCERRVATELRELGFRTYCPLGQKYVYFQSGKRTKKKVVKQFPLLSRYIFVGAASGAVVGKHASEKIHSVLGDAAGPIQIPIEALERINKLEVGGEWDDARFRPEISPFVKGRRVRIIDGPFVGFPATVDALESEDRLRVLVQMFGRLTPVPIDPCYAEAM